MSPPPTAREGSSGQTYLPLFYCTETNIYCKFELVANTQQMLFYKYEYMSKEDDDASPRGLLETRRPGVSPSRREEPNILE